MSTFIGHLYGKLKPNFVIMDAIECMEGDGPNTGDKKFVGVILAGDDGIAVDSTACEVYGYNSSEILHLVSSSEKGYGITKVNNINKTGNGWNRISHAKGKRSKADFLFKIPEKLFFLMTILTKCRPKVDNSKCIHCGLCKEACGQKAIYKKKTYKVHSSKCILCMCCVEACPHQAIALRTSFIWNKISS